ncbi:MAG: hypothetical protein IJ458_02335 [Clostridia bacterium]|nr:hypothetical protein [Clostridia bacterium]
MEIDERLIKKLIEDFTSSSKFSAEKSFNEIYDGFKEEYLNLKYHSEQMDLEEKKERLKCLSEKMSNLKFGFGIGNAQENRFQLSLQSLQNKVIHLYDKVEDKINNDKQLPF